MAVFIIIKRNGARIVRIEILMKALGAIAKKIGKGKGARTSSKKAKVVKLIAEKKLLKRKNGSNAAGSKRRNEIIDKIAADGVDGIKKRIALAH